MKFKLKLLSSIHIKSGTKISPYADFVCENDHLFYIDNNKLWNDISEKSEILEEYLKIIKERDSNASEKYMLSSFFESNNIDFKEYILDDVKCNYDIKSLEVSEVIKTSGRPYIPGSSIKGAIRTAILYNYLKINGADLESMLRLSSKKSARQTYVGQDVMRTRPKDIQSDIMRFLHVSDTNYTSLKDLSIKLEYNVDYLDIMACNELSLKSPGASEAIDENTIFQFDIKCLKENKFFKSEKDVLNCIRNFYKDLIEYHINVMKNSSEELFLNIISKYTEYLNDIEAGECILRLGSGKGFYDNTICKLFDSEVVNKRIAEVKYNLFPKTDWFVLDSENTSVKESLGWVKILLQ